MRKRKFARSLSVALSDEHFEQIKQLTDEAQISMAEWVRENIEKELSRKPEKFNHEKNEVDNEVNTGGKEKIIIERTKEEDINQLEKIQYIIENEPQYYDGVIDFDGLYELYSWDDNQNIYSRTDIIEILISNGYFVRYSREHDSMLCVFYE